MTTMRGKKASRDDADRAFLERLRAAAELLELVAADWRLLEGLPAAERRRFHDAIARIYNPDSIVRRRRMKAEERARKAAGTKREESMLQQTGIRELRRKPVFTTPNVFPPGGVLPRDVAAPVTRSGKPGYDVRGDGGAPT